MKDPFFIVGVQRSGTTLVSKMLGNHSSVLMEDQAKAYRLIGAFDNMYELLPYNLELPKTEFLEWIIANDKNDRISQVIDSSLLAKGDNVRKLIHGSLLSKVSKQGKTIWGDKAPNLQHYARDVSFYLPSAKFVHIVRDGRATAASMKKRSYRNIVLSADLWLQGNIFAIANQHILGAEKYMIVKYEDLLEAPETTMRKVCEFLEISFEPAVLDLSGQQSSDGSNYVKSFLDKGKIDRWKNELSVKEVRKVEEVQGDLLRHFGYEVSAQVLRPLSFRRKAYLMMIDNWRMLFRRKKKGMKDWQTVEYKDSFRSRFGRFAMVIGGVFFSRPLYKSLFKQFFYKEKKKTS